MPAIAIDRFDERRLLLRVAAPQQERDRGLACVDQPDDGVGEAFPAAALVRSGVARLDGQHRIEQQHPLFGPMFEKAVARGRYVEIGLKFLVDVDEAGRHADAGPDRKEQSMRSEGHTSELQSLMRLSYAVFCLKK